MTEDLLKVVSSIDALDALIEDEAARMFVVNETGADELCLVGTRDAYLRLARVLLEFVDGVDKNQVLPDGTGMPGTSAIGFIFDHRNAISIEAMAMSETVQQAREHMEHLRDL